MCVDTINSYFKNNKLINGTSNFMTFEAINDMQDQNENLFFIFHSNVDDHKYDEYFCLMDITKLCEAEKKLG